MLKDSKCIYCTERHIGCHSQCEDYKKWKAEVDEVSKAMREAKATVGHEYRNERYNRRIRKRKNYIYK